MGKKKSTSKMKTASKETASKKKAASKKKTVSKNDRKGQPIDNNSDSDPVVQFMSDHTDLLTDCAKDHYVNSTSAFLRTCKHFWNREMKDLCGTIREFKDLLLKSPE